MRRAATPYHRGELRYGQGQKRLFDGVDAEGNPVVIELRADEPALVADARGLVGVAHEALAPVRDAGESSGEWFVVRARWTGERLDELLGDAPLSPEQVVALLRPVASALDRLHEVGVTHCAFCPENVVVADEDAPRLWVIGAPSGAAFATSGADSDDTQTLTLKAIEGLDYVPPDLLESPARPDVYALGVLVFRMLAGDLPFRRYPTLTQTLVQRQEGSAARLAEVARRPMLPAIERWMSGVLAADPASRPPSATALVEGLARLTGGVIGEHGAAVRGLMHGLSEPSSDGALGETSLAIEVCVDGPRVDSIPPPSEPPLPEPRRSPDTTTRTNAVAVRRRSWRALALWVGLLVLAAAVLAVASTGAQ